MTKTGFKYNYEDIEVVFRKLISGNNGLTEHFEREVSLEGYNSKEDLPYVDVGAIARYIVEKNYKIRSQTLKTSLIMSKKFM